MDSFTNNQLQKFNAHGKLIARVFRADQTIATYDRIQLFKMSNDAFGAGATPGKAGTMPDL